MLLPTDVGYGLVAMQDSAVEQIYQLKGRPLSKPCERMQWPGMAGLRKGRRC